MKKIFSTRFFIVALVLICTSFTVVFFVAANTVPESFQQDEIEITECITMAEELYLEIGQVPETMLEATVTVGNEATVHSDMDSANLDQYKETQKNKIDQVYSGQIAEKIYRQYSECLDSMVSVTEEQSLSLQSTENQFVDITIDTGIINLMVSKLNINNGQATATSDFVAWDIRILEENEEYCVYMTMSQMNQSYDLYKESNRWCISDVSGYTQIFAPDGYEYKKGTFSTMEEAITFAKTLDPETENPF